MRTREQLAGATRHRQLNQEEGVNEDNPCRASFDPCFSFCLRTDVNGIEQFDVVPVIGEKPKIMVVVVAVVSILDRVGGRGKIVSSAGWKMRSQPSQFS